MAAARDYRNYRNLTKDQIDVLKDKGFEEYVWATLKYTLEQLKEARERAIAWCEIPGCFSAEEIERIADIEVSIYAKKGAEPESHDVSSALHHDPYLIP